MSDSPRSPTTCPGGRECICPAIDTADQRIEVESIVSMRTGEPGEPLVQLQWGGESGQLTPTQARQHARRLFEAAEAADQDAFLMEFLRDRVQVDLEHQLLVLQEFRQWRAKRDPEIEGAADHVG